MTCFDIEVPRGNARSLVIGKVWAENDEKAKDYVLGLHVVDDLVRRHQLTRNDLTVRHHFATKITPNLPVVPVRKAP